MDSGRTNRIRAFKIINGEVVETDPPTEEQLQSMDGQQAKMFLPNGQLRMVSEMKEKYRNGQTLRFATLEDRKNQPPMSREELIAQSNGILERTDTRQR